MTAYNVQPIDMLFPKEGYHLLLMHKQYSVKLRTRIKFEVKSIWQLLLLGESHICGFCDNE